jgi:hypothetical protein
MGDEHGEERRRGVEDRGETRRDVDLPPGDEREGNRVVEKPHAEERGPGGAIVREGRARDPQHSMQRERRQRHPCGDEEDRRDLPHRDAHEQERAAPQHRERQDHRPIAAAHDKIDAGGGLGHGAAPKWHAA